VTFSPIARCSCCTDEYDEVEYATTPQDADEPQFCSDDCEDLWWAAEDAAEAYGSAGYPAPAFGP
jgi:hypothetical protein